VKQITVSKENFRLLDLLEKSLNNDEIVDYPYGVFYGNANGTNWPIYLSYAKDGLVMNNDFTIHDTDMFLKESKDNFVFAIFSTTNIGEPILCVDGNCYGYAIEEHDEDYEEEIFIYEGDFYGYLIQLNEDKYLIDSVIYFSGGQCCSGEMLEESLRVKEDCGIFEQPIQAYINKFII
jgi:hypothetical protein